MLLAIDIGNTNTVLGLFEQNDEPLFSWRLSTDSSRTSDEYALMINELLHHAGFQSKAIDGVTFSSSVPQLIDEFRELSFRYFEVDPIIVGPGIRTGVNVLYDSPKDVGPDRITNAVAAYDQFGGPTIVVDLGTATTFDAISEDGNYLGGAIVPGIEISLNALYSKAAALRSVELAVPSRVIGKSTVESLQSGVIYGFALQVDGLVKKMKEELGEATVVATGGLAQFIKSVAQEINHVDPLLTLRGLKIIYERNQPGGS